MAWFFPEILTTESHRCPHLPLACHSLLLWTLCCKEKAVFHQTSHCLGRWLVTMLNFSLGCWGLRFNYRSKRSKATGSTHQSKLLDSNCYLKDLGPSVFFNFLTMYQKCAAGFFYEIFKNLVLLWINFHFDSWNLSLTKMLNVLKKYINLVLT